MMLYQKMIGWHTIISALLLFSTACDIIDSIDRDSASVYFYNQLTAMGFIDAQLITVDLFRASQSSALLTEQTYSGDDDSPRLIISLDSNPDDVTFTLRRSDNQDDIVTAVTSLDQGAQYSLIAMGDVKEGAADLVAYKRQFSVLATSEIRVRFIHTLSDLSGSLNIFYNDTQSLAEDLMFKSASSYTTITGFDSLLTVDIFQGEVELDTFSCVVEGGNTYDIIIAYMDFNSPLTLSLFCHATNVII